MGEGSFADSGCGTPEGDTSLLAKHDVHGTCAGIEPPIEDKLTRSNLRRNLVGTCTNWGVRSLDRVRMVVEATKIDDIMKE
eukprot:194041-Amphidinium_carterae.1